jgi:hypothetical protein
MGTHKSTPQVKASKASTMPEANFKCQEEKTQLDKMGITDWSEERNASPVQEVLHKKPPKTKIL